MKFSLVLFAIFATISIVSSRYLNSGWLKHADTFSNLAIRQAGLTFGYNFTVL